jgi:hypothetical protein
VALLLAHSAGDLRVGPKVFFMPKLIVRLKFLPIFLERLLFLCHTTPGSHGSNLVGEGLTILTLFVFDLIAMKTGTGKVK